jgi:hypothetical protein
MTHPTCHLHNRSRAFPIQKCCFAASHNKQKELQALVGGFASELQMPKTTKKTEGKLKRQSHCQDAFNKAAANWCFRPHTLVAEGLQQGAAYCTAKNPKD